MYYATKLHKLGKKEREQIVEEAGTINGLIRNKETLRRSEFTFPLPTANAIAALGKAEIDGL